MRWDATQYEKFDDHRTRPFDDLLSRIPGQPRRITDLGCGNGLATLRMLHRWPAAEITGVDSSAEMLAAARDHDTDRRIEWLQRDVTDWHPSDQPDLIITNAALQWVPGHEALSDRWLPRLPSGATFAMQVPGNFEADSHRIIRELVAEHPRAGELGRTLRTDPVLDPAGYADLLAAHCSHLDVWETTYLQLLDPRAQQRNPVLEWVRGTALRPILARLDRGESESFLAELDVRLARAYPRRPYGVPFPFRRIFAVGTR